MRAKRDPLERGKKNEKSTVNVSRRRRERKGNRGQTGGGRGGGGARTGNRDGSRKLRTKIGVQVPNEFASKRNFVLTYRYSYQHLFEKRKNKSDWCWHGGSAQRATALHTNSKHSVPKNVDALLTGCARQGERPTLRPQAKTPLPSWPRRQKGRTWPRLPPLHSTPLDTRATAGIQ